MCRQPPVRLFSSGIGNTSPSSGPWDGGVWNPDVRWHQWRTTHTVVAAAAGGVSAIRASLHREIVQARRHQPSECRDVGLGNLHAPALTIRIWPISFAGCENFSSNFPVSFQGAMDFTLAMWVIAETGAAL